MRLIFLTFLHHSTQRNGRNYSQPRIREPKIWATCSSGNATLGSSGLTSVEAHENVHGLCGRLWVTSDGQTPRHLVIPWVTRAARLLTHEECRAPGKLSAGVWKPKAQDLLSGASKANPSSNYCLSGATIWYPLGGLLPPELVKTGKKNFFSIDFYFIEKLKTWIH